MVMDREAIFTKAVEGIFAQGKLAYEQGHGCRYLTKEGYRCAVGQVISPKEAEDIEGSVPAWEYQFDTGDCGPNRVAKLAGAETQDDVKFLLHLQRCHDRQSEFSAKEIGTEMDRFFIAARMFAVVYELDGDVVIEAYNRHKHELESANEQA